MADVACPRCGEPWEVDSLHEIDGVSFTTAWKTFTVEGCAVFGVSCDIDPRFSLLADLYDLAGDDIDGAASDLEDAEMLGLFG